MLENNNKRSIKIRILRFVSIIIFLYASFYLLNLVYGYGMFAINYYIYIPLVYYFLKIIYLRYIKKFIFKNKTVLHAQPKLCNNKINLTTNTDHFLIKCKQNCNSILFLITILISISFLFSLLPATFYYFTLKHSVYASTVAPSYILDITKITENYLNNFLTLVPWPVIALYAGFIGLLVQKYGINDIHKLSLAVYPNKYKYDTLNNFIIVAFSFPYSFALIVFLITITLVSYYCMCNHLGLVAFSGLNILILVVSTITVIFVLQDYIIKIFNKYKIKKWSVSKFIINLMVFSVLLLVLFTLVFNLGFNLFKVIFISSNDRSTYNIIEFMQGGYSSYNKDLRLISTFFIYSVWWFSLPTIAYCCYRFLAAFHFITVIILTAISFIISYFVVNIELFNQIIFNSYIYIMSNDYLTTSFFIGLFIVINYFVFYNNKDRNVLFIRFFNKQDLNTESDSTANLESPYKKLQAGLVYDNFLRIYIILLLLTILGNLFIVQKAIVFVSIVQSLLFIYLIKGYFKFIR